MLSLNVGELAFYLTLDDSQYKQKMAGAKTAAATLQSAASRAGKVVAATVTSAAAATTGLVVGLTKAGASYNILQQNSRAALTTLLGSQKAVNEQMNKLNELAARSPFSKSVFISAQQQLLAFGMQAEKVIPTLDAIQNAVAATGGSSQQLADITFVLAQIQAAGKITGQDLLQLGQRGIDAATLIGNSLGKSGQEIRKDITAGALSAQTAIDALTQGMAAKFGGSTDLIKQQWTGAADRIKAAWRDMGATIAEPFINPNGGGQAVVWANRVADVMRHAHRQVSTLMRVVEERSGPVFSSVTHHLENAAAAVARFNMHSLIRHLDSLAEYKSVIAGVSGALLTFGSANIPVLGRLTASLNPLLVGLGALAATSPQLREVGRVFVDALTPAVPSLQALAREAADLALHFIRELSPSLSSVAQGVGRFVSDIAPLASLFTQALHAAVPFVRVVTDLAGVVAGLPSPLLAAGAAVLAFHGPLVQARTLVMSAAQAMGGAVASMREFWKASQIVAAETGLSTAMTAAKAATVGLSGVLSALLTPANLVGLGLTVLSGIVAAFIAKKAEATRGAQDFAATLDKETGAITDNTRAWVVKRLEEEGALDALERLGMSTSAAVDALINQGDAYAALTQQVADARQGLAQYVSVTGDLTREGLDAEDAIRVLEKAFPDLSDQIARGTDIQQRQARAMGHTTDATERQRQALDALTVAQEKQAAANGDLISAQYQTMHATEDLNQLISEGAGLHRDSAGAIDTTSLANERYVTAIKDKVEAINREVAAFAKAGHTQAEVNDRQKTLTRGLYEQLEALGVVGLEAEAFVKQLGLIPEHKATTYDLTLNTDKAAFGIEEFTKQIESKGGTLTIYADDSPATRILAQSLGLVRTSEGTYTINAKDDPAIAQLLMSLGKVNTSTGVITIDGNNKKVLDAASQAQASINRTTGTITINGRDYATQAAREAQKNINALEAAIKVWFTPQNAPRIPYMDGLHKKDGGIVSYYASGGVRENHVAQIAPAGAWRVWAEPETGGEAYIPLAASKRNRSQDIMAEVARRFGDVYIPRGERRFADGGLTGAPVSSTTTVNFGGVTIDAHTLEAVTTVVELVNRLGYSDLMNTGGY